MKPLCLRATFQCAGFTYISLLIFIGIVSVTGAATLQLGAVLQRRDAEEQLLAIGHEYREALISYARATPAGQATAPVTLQDLLRDPRYPGVQRHLRQLYTDPMTGNAEWGTSPTLDGNGIAGVHSLSTATPIKVGNFEMRDQGFDNKKSYSDWVFARPQPADLSR